MSWTAYTDTLQQLAAIRRQAAEHETQRGTALRQAQAHVDALTQRLTGLRSRLHTLATLLKLSPPYLDGVSPSSITDIGEATGRAAGQLETAEKEAATAETLAARPPLLPTMSPAGRAALVYGGWCLAGWLTQCALTLFSGTDVSAVLWSLCGLPALAFFAGFITLHIFGQPRIGGQIPYSIRLGGAVCFIGMPILWIGLIAFFTFLRS
jgi:hypothetical protein